MPAEMRGVRRLNAKFRRLPDSVKRETKQAVRLGGLVIENTAKGLIRQPGAGRVYKRRGVEHRASAPGEPPASDTGTLLGSVETVIVDDGLAAEVGTALNYGRFLEFGTSKVRPRPWLHPAFRINRQEVGRAIVTAMRRAVKNAGKL